MGKEPSNDAAGSGYGSGGGYYGGGYYYGDGDYGGGGPGGGQQRNQRGINEYLAIVRERIWWLIIALFCCTVTAGSYTAVAAKKFTAAATLQVLRDQARAVEFVDVINERVTTSEDFNTEVSLIQSDAIVQRVFDRLRDSDRRALMAPFEGETTLAGEQMTPQRIIMGGRRVSTVRQTLMVIISFTHQDKEVAARVANLLAEEYINYKTSQRLEASRQAQEELKRSVDEQAAKVRSVEMQMADLKQRYHTSSFEEVTDIDRQELMRLNEYATNDKRMLDEATAQWELIEQAKDGKRPLWEIPFIASNQQIPPLLQQRSQQRIEIAALAKRYRDKHPLMQRAREALRATEDELNRNVEAVAQGIYNNLQHAQANYDKSMARVSDKQQAMIDLERLRPAYEQLRRDQESQNAHYQYLHQRMQQTIALQGDDSQTARIVDHAVPPAFPSSPNMMLNMALGVFSGFGIGFGIIFLFAILDDKVKSAFDIENSIGLPILGVIARIDRSSPQARARVVANQSDRHTVEAFRSIHSAMKLNEESRNAKVILTTSTIPSEGKSFVTTNVAMTFATHGERTIVIDGDLRMPNVAKSLELENKIGILQVMEGTATLDDVIMRNVERNLDVLVTGGSTKNPTQVLCSEQFEQLIHELRLRYDKVLIDSPPLAPVSDALNILPLVDGVLYVIRFNMVKRKTANLNVRRLRESNVPVFGAILNNISASVAGYYYSHYYDRSYSRYYTSGDARDVNVNLTPGKKGREEKQPIKTK